MTGVIALDVFFSYIHAAGKPGTHLPTELWMFTSGLVGVMGGYLGGRRLSHHDPHSHHDHDPDPDPDEPQPTTT
jgi:hypothetical protein